MAKLSDTIAEKGVRPFSWQSKPPANTYSARFGQAIETSADFERIRALPRRPPVDLKSGTAAALVQLMTQRFAWNNPNCRCREIDEPQWRNIGCIKTLLPVQAWALYEMGITGGLIGAVPVGGGKTIIGLLAPLALEMKPDPAPPALLLVPPSLVKQLIIDYKMLAEHFQVPSLVVNGTHATRIAKPGMPVLQVLPYSQLSRPECSAWISNCAPSVILADECDKLKDAQTSTTARVLRYFAKNSDTKFCGWTGSLSDHSIREMWHLFALALRLKSPMPLEFAVVEDWARALDAGDDDDMCDPGVLTEFCHEGEPVREGFGRRLAETTGVIVTGTSEVSIVGTDTRVELEIIERQAPPFPPIVDTALKMVRSGIRPDTLVGAPMDEILPDALSEKKCALEVACGMFYRWRFPLIDGVPQQRSKIDMWYKRRRDWNRELRDFLMKREEHLDSPQLAEYAAQRFHGMRPKRPDRPEWPSLFYLPWLEICDEVKYVQEACRLDDFLVQDAAAWAHENTGIVWYSMVEFGSWVAEISKLPLHGGGPKAEDRIREERGDRSIIASAKSHGRGRNGLQHRFNSQLIANMAPGDTFSEQLLGRLHRHGQMSQYVHTEVYLHTDEVKANMEEAKQRARFNEQVWKGRRKLLLGLK